jgi:hypothetical protein
VSDSKKNDDDVVALFQSDDETSFAGLTNGQPHVAADLTIENVLAAMDEFKNQLPKPPRVANDKDGRVYIVIDGVWYQFPEGTKRDYALSVLSEAMSIAQQRDV